MLNWYLYLSLHYLDVFARCVPNEMLFGMVWNWGEIAKSITNICFLSVNLITDFDFGLEMLDLDWLSSCWFHKWLLGLNKVGIFHWSGFKESYGTISSLIRPKWVSFDPYGTNLSFILLIMLLIFDTQALSLMIQLISIKTFPTINFN